MKGFIQQLLVFGVTDNLHCTNTTIIIIIIAFIRSQGDILQIQSISQDDIYQVWIQKQLPCVAHAWYIPDAMMPAIYTTDAHHLRHSCH